MAACNLNGGFTWPPRRAMKRRKREEGGISGRGRDYERASGQAGWQLGSGWQERALFSRSRQTEAGEPEPTSCVVR